MGVKKQNTKSTNPIEKPLTEDEYYEMVSEENSRLEHENYIKHFNQFSKDELIQMLMEFQETEQKFSDWMRAKSQSLTAYGGGLTAINDEFENLIRDRKSRLKKQKTARQEQATKDVAKKPEAQALGVNDFYGLIREAINKFNQIPIDQRPKQTNIGSIREIIVDLLCQPNYSRHIHERDQWIIIVKRNVTPKHIDRANQKLKRKKPKAT